MPGAITRDDFPVTFQPGSKPLLVLHGTRLLEAAAAADLVLDAPCGGEGTCGKCRVMVIAGAMPPTPAEGSQLTAAEIQAGCRLACQTIVTGPMQVEVPESSLADRRYQIVVQGESEPLLGTPGSDQPVITKRYVELPPPTRGSDAADLARLQAATGPCRADIEVLRTLPGKLRAGGFRGTLVSEQDRLLDFEPGNTVSDSYAVAVDVGTTTLVAALLDVVTGRELHVTARLNPQTRFGDDVLSRILMTRRDADGLQTLGHAVSEAIDAMIGELCAAADIRPQQVYAATISGNTTMQQLFSRLDTRPLGEIPFVPAVQQGMSFPASEVGLHIHPQGHVYTLPVVGGFVGGDTVAGILATGLTQATAPTLFIDIGTNGEIVLAAHGKLTAAATAAGPAFEGARITHGMRASEGAIERVVFDGRLQIYTIGNATPRGLCGSALIDTAAELLRFGMLTPNGRFVPPEKLPEGLPSDLARRLVTEQGQCGFVLSEPDERAGGASPGRIVLWQRDIRELQLASGAIRAGIELLLRRHGLTAGDLDRVLVAGGFGYYIRRSNAQRIGLLPPEIDPARISYQGNTSLAGARLVALSRRFRSAAESVAAATEHVDLSMEADFLDVYAAAMHFPKDEDAKPAGGS
jgi:uncharacterized 2Fe-2S/4Fe-4S cluster protein (DUF4445 family)